MQMRMVRFNGFFKKFISRVGIDLGTSNTPVFIRGKGIIFSEPSFVARNGETGKVLAVGDAAKRMHGKTPAHITVIRPLRDGVIANFEIAYEMLRHLMDRALPNRGLIKPYVIVGVPSDCTPVERRAVEEAARHAGGGRVILVAQPVLAALGAGLPVKEPVGSMIVDIGGGTTEIAIVSLGGVVYSQSLRVAGDKMDDAISTYVKKKTNLLIGERTAEAIKIQIASVHPKSEEKSMEVRGRDVFSGLPRVHRISSADVRESLIDAVGSIIEAIRNALEMAPPELVSDIMERGIVIAGGGSLLSGLEEIIQEATGVPCRRAEDPILCVAKGTGVLFEDDELLEQVATRRAKYWEIPGEVA